MAEQKNTGNKRKAISQKLRFEVFKRDNFTCQYCGRMAPDVILEVDHINPVKNGGKNTILNLITSCKDCNRGKGAKELTDGQVIKQQQEQLKELNDRRQQLKLMLKWKKELEKLEEEKVNSIESIFIEKLEVNFSDAGRRDIRKLIKNYGLEEVIESTNLSINQYYTGGKESADNVFSYIPKICTNRRQQKNNPFIYKSNYIKAIIRNRFGIYNNNRLWTLLQSLVVDEESFSTIKDIACQASGWKDFFDLVNETYGTNF